MIPADQPESTASHAAAQLSDFSILYYDRLHPWCIVRLLPQMQRVIVARFRRRNDAEEHLKVLKRLQPQASYVVLFDMMVDALHC
ncbi:MAG: hypothetical protein Kow00121_67680 [Elainellaceae cyanobacterium]